MDHHGWKFINSFAPWFSALGSIGAAVIALHIARRSNRAIMKISNNVVRIVGAGQIAESKTEYLKLEVHNMGLRPVRISGIFWTTGFIKKQNFIQLSPKNQLSSPMPATLQQGDEASYFFDLSEMPDRMRTIADVIKKSKVPRLTFRTLKVGFYTSAGDKILASVSEEVRKWLRDTYSI